ncbi:MAG: hypothetical protein JST39_02620 [Bacteroidetes bacterium]|nr:hypothetical protein [Bacteroidota bacterium]
MDEQQHIEERLWDYIDGLGSDAEKNAVQSLIATNEAWREQYESLLSVHRMLHQQLDIEMPPLRFTQNVMEAIATEHISPAARTYIDKKIIRGIGLFFLVTLCGLFIYGVAQVRWTSSGSVTGDWWDKLSKPQIDWSRLFNNTYLDVFMMVNVVLGLMLLDMYLGRKKKQWK